MAAGRLLLVLLCAEQTPQTYHARDIASAVREQRAEQREQRAEQRDQCESVRALAGKLDAFVALLDRRLPPIVESEPAA